MKHTRKLAILAWLALPFLFGPGAAAEPGLVVTREVTGDRFSMAVALGASQGCPDRLALPSPGDEVRLSVVPGRARRDEPGLSVIVLLDAGEALVLHHAAETYSRLPYPPKDRHLESQYRRNMGTAAKDVYPWQLLGDVDRSAGTLVGRRVEVRTAGIESALLGRLDVEVAVYPEGELGEAAFAVEELTQAIRDEGESWLSQVGPGDGVPLRIAVTRHEPSAKVHREETATEVTATDLDPALFQVPEGYRKTDHRPICF